MTGASVLSATASATTSVSLPLSLRYPRHLAPGEGMVLPPGEYVEGYTSFIWTVLAAVFIGLRADAVTALSVIGGVSGVALVAVTVLLSARARSSSRPCWDLRAI